ncbi:MAG TPA: hypothetical protein VH349_10040 [Ktedonobacterales bacterium]|jgi:hypothetical protein
MATLSSNAQPLQATARPAPRQILDCRIAGSLVSIQDLPSSLRPHVEFLLQPFAVEAQQVKPTLHLRIKRNGPANWAVFVGETQVSGGCGAIACVLPTIEWHAVTRAAEASAEVAIFHAATLTRRESTVMLVAPSAYGKTTLTLGLMARGWLPLADDLTVIDPSTLRAHPFPRCFHIYPNTMQLLPAQPELEWSRILSAYARPQRWAEEERQPGAIVIVQRDPEQPSTRTPVTQAEAAGALMISGFRNQLSGSRRAEVAVRLAAQARQCCQITNGPIADTLDLIEAAAE